MRKMPLLTDCFLKRIPLFLPLSNKKSKRQPKENRAYRVQTSRKAV